MHIMHLHNGIDLMIDSNGMDRIPVPEAASPLFFIPAEDIDKAAAHAESLGFQLLYSGIERNEYVSYFNMRDDDFNVITVCQQHK